PKSTTYMLSGEATVENLSSEIIRLLAPKMPQNVQALGVYIYEGVNKGAHIIAGVKKEDLMSDKALVMLSGGLDSATCLYWAKAKFSDVSTITFNYFGRLVQEKRASSRLATGAGVIK